MASLSQEEMRAARLRALEGASSSAGGGNPLIQPSDAQGSEMETDQGTAAPTPAPTAVEEQQRE